MVGKGSSQYGLWGRGVQGGTTEVMVERNMPLGKERRGTMRMVRLQNGIVIRERERDARWC